MEYFQTMEYRDLQNYLDILSYECWNMNTKKCKHHTMGLNQINIRKRLPAELAREVFHLIYLSFTLWNKRFDVAWILAVEVTCCTWLWLWGVTMVSRHISQHLFYKHFLFYIPEMCRTCQNLFKKMLYVFISVQARRLFHCIPDKVPNSPSWWSNNMLNTTLWIHGQVHIFYYKLVVYSKVIRCL